MTCRNTDGVIWSTGLLVRSEHACIRAASASVDGSEGGPRLDDRAAPLGDQARSTSNERPLRARSSMSHAARSPTQWPFGSATFPPRPPGDSGWPAAQDRVEQVLTTPIVPATLATQSSAGTGCAVTRIAPATSVRSDVIASTTTAAWSARPCELPDRREQGDVAPLDRAVERPMQPHLVGIDAGPWPMPSSASSGAISRIRSSFRGCAGPEDRPMAARERNGVRRP